MLNVAEVEDVILQAKADFNRMHTDIVKEYMRPYEELSKAMLLKWMNPVLKQELNNRIPGTMAKLEQKYNRKEGV